MNVPDARVDFPASNIFDRYYGPECLIGASDTLNPNGDSAARFVEETRNSFIEKAGSLGTPRAQDFRLHQEAWSVLRTTKTCIFCCLRYVEHKITCGHYLCEHCVTSVSHDVGLYKFHLEKCPICRAKVYNSIVAKPPTAGPSLLGFDGGGVRGIAILEFLRLLQVELGGAYPIQEYFDFVVATSAGGQIARKMFPYADYCRSLNRPGLVRVSIISQLDHRPLFQFRPPNLSPTGATARHLQHR